MPEKLFFIFFASLLSLPVSLLSAAESEDMRRSSSPIPFETKLLIYEEEKGLVFFKDGFVISRDSQSLEGQTMIYSTATGRAEAFDNLIFRDPNMILRGNRLSMNLEEETFHWSNGVTGHFTDNTWFFRARYLDGTPEFYKARRAQFTSCTDDPPHYHIKAWNGKIIPGEKATFYHALFFIGPVPLLYWPWFTKALSEEPRPTFYIAPGQNGRDGSFLKSIIAYPLLENRLYLRTHLDYFSKHGVGGGPEIIFRDGENRKGAFSFYTVQQKSGDRLWTMYGDSYYQFNPAFSAQGTVRYQSDQNFNSFYSRENPEKVRPELRSSAALNWRRGNLQLRPFYSDVMVYEQRISDFWSTDQTLPGFEAILHPYHLPVGGLYFNANLVTQRRRTRAEATAIPAFDRWEDSGSARLARPWNLPAVRWIGGNIGGVFNHSYVSKLSDISNQSRKQSTYGGDLNMRLSPGSLLDLSFTYSYLLRSEIDSLRQDTKASDRGIAQKRLEAVEMSRLPFNSFLFMRTAYNFQTPCDFTVCANPIDWTQSLEPVFGSLTLNPYLGGSYTFSTNYEVFARKYIHNINIMQYGARANLTTNIGYDNRRPTMLLPTFTAGFPVPRIFDHVSLTLRTEYFSDKLQTLSLLHRHTWRYYEREVVVVPAFHDFLMTLVFRSRPRPDPVREFLFTIRLRFSAQQERKQIEKMREDEYYPWRANTQVYTP